MIDSKKMVTTICKALETKKAEDITIIDISNISTIADYFIITNGNSLPHVQTLTDEVQKELSISGLEPTSVEGSRGSSWILIDYIDVIIHVFIKEDREFYNLERIWRDGRFVSLKDVLTEDE